MVSLIFKGRDALDAARILSNAKLAVAFDLGPDYGQSTARLYFPERIVNGEHAILELIKQWINSGWFGDRTSWEVVHDGPPYSQAGIPAVDGTPI